MLHPFRDRRRKGILKQPFPPLWSQVMDRNVPCCGSLLPDERKRLEDLVKVFISEKRFEGCGGLAITDEIKVTIAAQACLLLLNLRHNYYENLVSILVYPRSFNVEQEENGPAHTVDATGGPVTGLSSSTGAVALSWTDTVRGAKRPADGANVVFHEFAHQLDQLDGAPEMDSASMYRDWARVLGAEHTRLLKELDAGAPSLFSDYDVVQPAEFFAFATELFFEKPVKLRQRHPGLYGQLRLYFRQDPAARKRECMKNMSRSARVLIALIVAGWLSVAPAAAQGGLSAFEKDVRSHSSHPSKDSTSAPFTGCHSGRTWRRGSG